jgi:hypothetical protein
MHAVFFNSQVADATCWSSSSVNESSQIQMFFSSAVSRMP